MSKAQTAYGRLLAHVRQTAVLSSCLSLLHWDQQTCMPPASAAFRATQIAELSGLCHQRTCMAEVGEWLAICERSRLARDPGSPEAANLREIRRQYNRAMDMPLRLVEELARVTAEAHGHWVEARRQADFSLFAPWLERIVRLKREEAEAIGYRHDPYDVMLQTYEPGLTTEEVRTLFDSLAGDLAAFVAVLRDAPQQPDPAPLQGHFPVEAQAELGRMLVERIGFRLDAGRIDTAVHPFCIGISPEDTRITTRYEEADFTTSLFGLLHEAGHGLYNQGLPGEAFGTPLGQPASLSIHESQSRFWENRIGRGRSFWNWFYPHVQAAYPDALRERPLEEVYRALHVVRPGAIRVDADELTYNLHIILRFEMEQALLSDRISVDAVPAWWNDRSRDLLGVDIRNDAEGCLQDVHWSMGAFGYFPTYALGNVYAACFHEAAQARIPDLDARIGAGDFGSLRDWLRREVHAQGMRYPGSAALVEAVTGEAPTTAPLLRHLRTTYAPLYGLSPDAS